MRQTLTIFGKTVADLSSPKVLAGYFVPFLSVALFLGFAMSLNNISGKSVPVVQQETELIATFLMMSYFWAAGVPLLALGAVLCANTIAREAEEGTLRILLSKPVSRWKVFFGTFLAIVAFSGLVALAGTLMSGLLLVVLGDVSAAAISQGIFVAIPGNIVFALFGSSLVAGVGLAFAVLTLNRLRTALGGLVVSVLYFAFIPVRIFTGDIYQDYLLYLFDVNYHFGNAFVLIHEAFGVEFGLETRVVLSMWSGVYESPESGTRLDRQLPESLETVGHVSMEASSVLLLFLTFCALGFGMYRFQRMDV